MLNVIYLVYHKWHIVVTLTSTLSQPAKDASDGSSGDVLHEDGHHMLAKRGAQEADDVGVSEGFQQLYFLLQATVLPPGGVRVRSIQAHLLHCYQLALTRQATVHLDRKRQQTSNKCLY